MPLGSRGSHPGAGRASACKGTAGTYTCRGKLLHVDMERHEAPGAALSACSVPLLYAADCLKLYS